MHSQLGPLNAAVFESIRANVRLVWPRSRPRETIVTFVSGEAERLR